MSRRITFIKKCGVLFFALMIMQVAVKAATFTAVASGNFSSAATWGGVAPTTNVLLDNIVIPSGVTVTLDQNVRINGILSTLDVNGTLISSSNSALILTAGTLSGAGTIDVDSLVVDLTTGFTFTGSIIADDFSSLASGVSSSADITVTNQLWLAAGSSLDFVTNGSLTVNNNATIIITGNGLFTSTSGTVNLTGNYNVMYNGGSSTSGLELTGTGLQSVTLNLASNSASVTLSTDVLLNGTLSLQSGMLVLDGNDLVIGANGDIAVGGSGAVVSTSASNISINADGGTAGSLHFTGNTNAVGNLVVNVGAGNQTGISGTLYIANNLALATGTLSISNSTVTLNGALSGNGSLFSNAGTTLNITTAAGLSTDLRFVTGGQMIGTLNVSVGSGTSVSLGSALQVTNTLVIDTGTQFNISDVQVTIAGVIVGTGTFTTNSGTGIILNTAANNDIYFTNVNGTVGTFAFSGDHFSTTTFLHGDLTVATTLTLQEGRLNLYNNDLIINGGITAGGNGTIISNDNSNITVNTSTVLNGGLTFSGNTNSIGTLTVNVGAGNSLMINTDLHITDALIMQGGTIDIDGNDLYIAAGATVTGGSSDNYVITSEGGSLQMALTANNSATFHVGTASNYAPAMVELNSGSGSGSVGVSVLADVMAQGITGADLSSNQSVVDATWHIESDITANLNMDLQVMWGAALEVNSFDRTMAYVSHYTNGAWDATATASATTEANGMFSIRRDGITSLSPFAVFDNKTVTGIKETANAVEFKMFPVPANNTISFTYNDDANSNMKVDILDAQGNVLGTYELGASNSAVSISNLAAGTYLARVYNNQVNSVQRFTKL